MHTVAWATVHVLASLAMGIVSIMSFPIGHGNAFSPGVSHFWRLIGHKSACY